jgi:superfamily I DNA/RNA helicase
MVVGDDAQSIFGWRGANFTNIYRFKDRYPEARLHRLEINYRSTPRDSDASQRCDLQQPETVSEEPPGERGPVQGLFQR